MNSEFCCVGYPRTVDQAQFIWDNANTIGDLNAIHISLERWVAIEKLQGRRLCNKCGQSFNVTGILEGGFRMPAVLPTTLHCQHFASTPQRCMQSFESRLDDTFEAISLRLQDYEAKTVPVLNDFQSKHGLKTFVVKKGIDDTDDLIKLLLS